MNMRREYIAIAIHYVNLSGVFNLHNLIFSINRVVCAHVRHAE